MVHYEHAKPAFVRDGVVRYLSALTFDWSIIVRRYLDTYCGTNIAPRTLPPDRATCGYLDCLGNLGFHASRGTLLVKVFIVATTKVGLWKRRYEKHSVDDGFLILVDSAVTHSSYLNMIRWP